MDHTVVEFTDRLAGYRQRVEAALDRNLPAASVHPPRLHAALRYSVLGGGKRIRPLLAYATGEVLEIDPLRIDPIAVAIEFVHAYSLVHDDLPAMDDDHLRRGRPTTHIAYDEATAILVGDALQALAYRVLAMDQAYQASPQCQRQLITSLAEASGSLGMAGGQAMDMEAEGISVSAAQLEDIYMRKTGCLIRAAIIMPCHCSSRVPPGEFSAMDRFGQAIGLAFQIADDVLDVEGAPEVIGKPSGSDVKNQKATYPALFGIDAARRRTADLYAQAMEELGAFGRRAEPLRSICRYVIHRDR